MSGKRGNVKGEQLMKQILVIQGGGRAGGNTAQLTDSFIKGAEDAGHQAEKYHWFRRRSKAVLDAMPAGMENLVFNEIAFMRLFQK